MNECFYHCCKQHIDKVEWRPCLKYIFQKLLNQIFFFHFVTEIKLFSEKLSENNQENFIFKTCKPNMTFWSISQETKI